jgi:hypothetical protein
MARLNTGDEVLESLTAIDLYREATGTHGDTLTTAAILQSDLTTTVAAITNFTTLDPVLIVGDAGHELNSLNGAPAGLILTLLRKLVFAQSAGARVVEMVKVSIGHIGEDSAEYSGSPAVNAVAAATSKFPIAYIAVGGELSFKFSLLGYNIENMQLAFGVIENVIGAGTSADPYQGGVGLTSPNLGLLAFRARGVRKDGSLTEVDFLGCTITGSPTENISGKSGRPIPIEGRCVCHIKRIWK